MVMRTGTANSTCDGLNQQFFSSPAVFPLLGLLGRDRRTFARKLDRNIERQKNEKGLNIASRSLAIPISRASASIFLSLNLSVESFSVRSSCLVAAGTEGEGERSFKADPHA